MTYYCPYLDCGCPLSEDDVIRGTCSRCHRVFDQPVSQAEAGEHSPPADQAPETGDEAGKVCPYCQAPIKPGLPLTVCPACEMPHHTECWDENNGCTTYGCNQQQATRQTRPAHSRPPVGTAYAPPPPDQNTSGQGSTAVVPEAIKRWNWGAFWLCFIWSACNNVWIGLLALIPYLNLVMSIVLGVKGNELAWQNKKWESVEHFQRVQENWAKAGWTVFVLGVLISLMLVS